MGGLQKNKIKTYKNNAVAVVLHTFHAVQKKTLSAVRRFSSHVFRFDNIMPTMRGTYDARQTTMRWVRYSKANTHCGY